MGFLSSVWKSVTKPIRSTVKAVSKVFGGGSSGSATTQVIDASSAPPITDIQGNNTGEQEVNTPKVAKRKKKGKSALSVATASPSKNTGLNV